jgi:hypothetical protein
MEDFQQRAAFEVEKFVTNMFISPLLQPISFDPLRMRNRIENFESPFFTSFDLLKSNFHFPEQTPGVPLHKDDDFALDSNVNLKSELPSHVYTQSMQPQLDISFDPTAIFKPQDPFLGFNQISRSRGPSFNLGRGRLGSEDMFNGNNDLLSFFKHEEPQSKRPNILKAEYQDSYLDHEFAHNNTHASPNFLPKKLKTSTENEYGFTLQPLNLDNATLQNETYTNKFQQNDPGQSKSKKKRKLNNNDETHTPEKNELNSPKLTKAKSENKQKFSVVPSNSLKLKITKLGEVGGDVNPQKPKAKKQSGKKNKGEISVKVETDPKFDDKATDSSTTKVEDMGLLRSQSVPYGQVSQMKKPENARDIWGNFAIPSEVEEYINNSGVLNHLPFHASRKIGTLTVEERRIKIEKYLEKRKKRTWCKKISYDCRKRVADSRLRIKGRFVTKDQAFVMLGSEASGLDMEKISNTEIKTLLLQKFGATSSKRKDKLDKNSELKNEEAHLDGSQMNELDDLNEFMEINDLDDSNVNL